MHRALLLVALLGAGCAETTAPGPFASPAALRRPAVWQQFCEQAASVPQATALVGARGAEGFELVAMYNGVLCYKRPAPEQVRPSASPPAISGGSLVPVVRDPGF
jgi:hypothetical protein